MDKAVPGAGPGDYWRHRLDEEKILWQD